MSDSQYQTPADRIAAVDLALTEARIAYDAAKRRYKAQTSTPEAQESPDVRKALEELHAPALRADEAVAMKEADAATAEVASLRALGALPRMNASDDVKIQANILFTRQQHRVATMPLDKLVDHVRAAMEFRDEAELLNYVDLLPDRIDGNDAGLSQREREAKATLRSLHREIVDAMRDKSIDEIEDEMRAVMQAASELRSDAGKYARESAPKRRYSFQQDGDVVWPKAG